MPIYQSLLDWLNLTRMATTVRITTYIEPLALCSQESHKKLDHPHSYFYLSASLYPRNYLRYEPQAAHVSTQKTLLQCANIRDQQPPFLNLNKVSN